MKLRPTSITVIAWLLLIGSIFSLISTVRNLDNSVLLQFLRESSVPVNLFFGWSYANCIVTFIAGIGMLAGQNWARVTYVAWRGAFLALEAIVMPMGILSTPGILFFIVVVIVLFLPKANRYFAGPALQASEAV